MKRRLRKEFEELRKIADGLRLRHKTGVVVLPEAEFEVARRTWPKAGPGEYGCLLACEQLTMDEWIQRHSPQPPTQEPSPKP